MSLSGVSPKLVFNVQPQEFVYNASEEFNAYVKQVKNGVISNPILLNETLNLLKNTINDHFGIGFERDQWINMFHFPQSNNLEWKVKLELPCQFEKCIKKKEPQEALNLIKEYISFEFKEKIETIHTDQNRTIFIKWKA